MQLQLRPHLRSPMFRLVPMYRQAGFAGLGLTPGYTPAQQAMADAYAAQFGAAPAVYQAPTPVAVPACTLDTQPGGAAFSQACIDQLLAAQQQNLAAGSAANYAVDRANCETAWAENDARYASLGLPRPPNDCAQRTFGLTLPNSTGGTNILTPNAQAIFDPTYAGPGSAPATAPAPTVTPSLKFTNLTSGNSSVLKVGDRWQIQITGAIPNAPVSVTGGQNGAHDTTPMGSTDSSGNWTSNGQISADQIGSWTEAWTVGGQPVGNFAFTVVPASGAPGTGGSTSKTPATKQVVTGSFMDLLSKTTVIGGTSIPDWALVGAALVAGYFLFMRGR